MSCNLLMMQTTQHILIGTDYGSKDFGSSFNGAEKFSVRSMEISKRIADKDRLYVIRVIKNSTSTVDAQISKRKIKVTNPQYFPSEIIQLGDNHNHKNFL